MFVLQVSLFTLENLKLKKLNKKYSMQTLYRRIALNSLLLYLCTLQFIPIGTYLKRFINSFDRKPNKQTLLISKDYKNTYMRIY